MRLLHSTPSVVRSVPLVAMGFPSPDSHLSRMSSACRRGILRVLTANNLFWAGTTLLFGPYLYVIPAFSHNKYILTFSFFMVVFGLCFWVIMYYYFVTVPNRSTTWIHPEVSDVPHLVVIEDPPQYETLQQGDSTMNPPPPYEDVLRSTLSTTERPPSYSNLFSAVPVCGVHQVPPQAGTC